MKLRNTFIQLHKMQDFAEWFREENSRKRFGRLRLGPNFGWFIRFKGTVVSVTHELKTYKLSK